MVRVHLGLPVTFFEKKAKQRNFLREDGETAIPNYGGVAQLGEHLPCKQGVMGSNPIISTMRYGIGQKRTLKLESKDSNRGGSE